MGRSSDRPCGLGADIEGPTEHGRHLAGQIAANRNQGAIPERQFRGHHTYFAETLHFVPKLTTWRDAVQVVLLRLEELVVAGRWSPVNLPSRCDRSIHGRPVREGPHSLKRKTTDHTDATDEKDLHCDPSVPIGGIRGPFFPPSGLLDRRGRGGRQWEVGRGKGYHRRGRRGSQRRRKGGRGRGERMRDEG